MSLSGSNSTLFPSNDNTRQASLALLQEHSSFSSIRHMLSDFSNLPTECLHAFYDACLSALSHSQPLTNRISILPAISVVLEHIASISPDTCSLFYDVLSDLLPPKSTTSTVAALDLLISLLYHQVDVGRCASVLLKIVSHADVPVLTRLKLIKGLGKHNYSRFGTSLGKSVVKLLEDTMTSSDDVTLIMIFDLIAYFNYSDLLPVFFNYSLIKSISSHIESCVWSSVVCQSDNQSDNESDDQSTSAKKKDDKKKKAMKEIDLYLVRAQSFFNSKRFSEYYEPSETSSKNAFSGIIGIKNFIRSELKNTYTAFLFKLQHYLFVSGQILSNQSNLIDINSIKPLVNVISLLISFYPLASHPVNYSALKCFRILNSNSVLKSSICPYLLKVIGKFNDIPNDEELSIKVVNVLRGSIYLASELCFKNENIKNSPRRSSKSSLIPLNKTKFSDQSSPRSLLPCLVDLLDVQDSRVYAEILCCISQCISKCGHLLEDEWWFIVQILVTIEDLIFRKSYNPAHNYVIKLTNRENNPCLFQNYAVLTPLVIDVIRKTIFLSSSNGFNGALHYLHLLMLIGFPIVEPLLAVQQIEQVIEYLGPDVLEWTTLLSSLFNSILRREVRVVVSVNGIRITCEFLAGLPLQFRKSVCELVSFQYLSTRSPLLVCSLSCLNCISTFLLSDSSSLKQRNLLIMNLFEQLSAVLIKYSVKNLKNSGSDEIRSVELCHSFVSIIQILLIRSFWNRGQDDFVLSLFNYLLTNLKYYPDIARKNILYFISKISCNHTNHMIINQFDCQNCGSQRDSCYTCQNCLFFELLRFESMSGDPPFTDDRYLQQSTTKFFEIFDKLVNHFSDKPISSLYIKSGKPTNSAIKSLKSMGISFYFVEFPIQLLSSMFNILFNQDKCNISSLILIFDCLSSWIVKREFSKHLKITDFIELVLSHILEFKPVLNLNFSTDLPELHLFFLTKLIQFLSILPQFISHSSLLFINFIKIVKMLFTKIIPVLPRHNASEVKESQAITLILSLIRVISIAATEDPKTVVNVLDHVFIDLLNFRFDPMASSLLFFIHTLISVARRPPPAIVTADQQAVDENFQLSNILTISQCEKVAFFLLSLTNSVIYRPRIYYYAAHVSIYLFVRLPLTHRVTLARTYHEYLSNSVKSNLFSIENTIIDFILRFSVSDPIFPHRLFKPMSPPTASYSSNHFAIGTSLLTFTTWCGGCDVIIRRPSGSCCFRLGALPFVPNLEVASMDKKEVNNLDTSQETDLYSESPVFSDFRPVFSKLSQNDESRDGSQLSPFSSDDDSDSPDQFQNCFGSGIHTDSDKERDHKSDSILNTSGIFSASSVPTTIPFLCPLDDQLLCSTHLKPKPLESYSSSKKTETSSFQRIDSIDMSPRNLSRINDNYVNSDSFSVEPLLSEQMIEDRGSNREAVAHEQRRRSRAGSILGPIPIDEFHHHPSIPPVDHPTPKIDSSVAKATGTMGALGHQSDPDSDDEVNLAIKNGVVFPPFSYFPDDAPTFQNPILTATTSALLSSQVTDDRILKSLLPYDAHWNVPMSPTSVFSEIFGQLLSNNTSVYMLKNDPKLERFIQDLDRVPAFEVHKVGIVYLKQNQSKAIDILSNSEPFIPTYSQFLSCLGRIVYLKHCAGVYNAGLDCENGTDGEYSLIRMTPLSCVHFHVASFMPNIDSDPSRDRKRRHLGNDYVLIIFCEPGAKFSKTDMSIGDFNTVFIVIEPIGSGFFNVSLDCSRHADPELILFVNNIGKGFVLRTSSLVPFVSQISTCCSRLCTVKHHLSAACRAQLRSEKIGSIFKNFSSSPLDKENFFEILAGVTNDK
ncbi:hypothetical protein P9112_014330 [Eukaryota sp. TZLM1-RC]